MKMDLENKLKTNTIVWGTQGTVDYSYRFSTVEDLTPILEYFIKENIFPGIAEKIKNEGMKEGEFSVDDKDIQKAIEFLDKEKLGKKMTTLGGSPLISALYGYYLRNREEKCFPKTYYCGAVPNSVRNFIRDVPNPNEKSELEEIFSYGVDVDANPGTFSIEIGKSKIMLSNSSGRELKDLDKNQYLENLQKIIEKHDGKVVLALGGLNKGSPKEYQDFIHSVKEKFPEIMIFVGTNSFTKFSRKEIGEYWEAIKLADIVSFNDEELKAVYDNVHFPENISLGQKLKELEFSGIKICHGAEGAALEVGAKAGNIANNPLFKSNPSNFLTSALQYAVDGAAFIYDNSQRKGGLTDTALIVYSENIRERQRAGFRVRFISSEPELANGLVGVMAPTVTRPRGALTGLGAIFDSLFLCYLMKNQQVN